MARIDDVLGMLMLSILMMILFSGILTAVFIQDDDTRSTLLMQAPTAVSAVVLAQVCIARITA